MVAAGTHYSPIVLVVAVLNLIPSDDCSEFLQSSGDSRYTRESFSRLPRGRVRADQVVNRRLTNRSYSSSGLSGMDGGNI